MNPTLVMSTLPSGILATREAHSGQRIKAVTPLYDRVLVRPLSAEGRTKGGLVIPDLAKGNVPYARGEVIAVGGGRTNLEGKTVPLQVRIGQIVLYDRKDAVHLPLGDDEVVMVREPAILGVVELEDVPLIMEATP